VLTLVQASEEVDSHGESELSEVDELISEDEVSTVCYGFKCIGALRTDWWRVGQAGTQG